MVKQNKPSVSKRYRGFDFYDFFSLASAATTIVATATVSTAIASAAACEATAAAAHD